MTGRVGEAGVRGGEVVFVLVEMCSIVTAGLDAGARPRDQTTGLNTHTQGSAWGVWPVGCVVPPSSLCYYSLVLQT